MRDGSCCSYHCEQRYNNYLIDNIGVMMMGAETEEFAAGVRLAVPKFFINGREPLGRSLDAFSTVIDEEIKKVRYFTEPFLLS